MSTMTKAERRFLVDEVICGHIDQIAAHFTDPNIKITLLVRAPNEPNGDILITNDSFAEIRAALDRREAAGNPRYRDLAP